MRSHWPLGLVLAGSLAGCRQTNPPPGPIASNQAPPQAPLYLDHAQPRLATVRLWLGDQEVTAEVAHTLTQIATGMMFRTNMAESEGMLFVFPEPHQTSFYMRNTTLPLSVAYIDPDGVILEIHDLKPLDETPIEAKTDQVQYTLEMKQGWFARHKIRPGVVIRTERGQLAETFAPGR